MDRFAAFPNGLSFPNEITKGFEIQRNLCHFTLIDMARRSRKSFNPTWVALICILIVVGFAGAFLLFRGANEPYRTTEELDPTTN